MTLIEPTDRPLFWAEYVAGKTANTGTTQIGDITATSRPVVSDSDENALLNALITGGVSAPTMPDAGEQLEQGDIYDFGGTLYMVRQSHTRTEHDPADVPALFTTYRVDAGAALDWIVREQVYVGTWRMYEGVLYECLQAHQTQTDWTPPQVLGVLWGVVALTAEWAAGKQYLGDNTEGAGNGDVVTYQGAEYRCQQSHTSQIGWEPPNVPALWIAL